MATSLYKARLNDAKQQLMNSSPDEMDIAESDIFESTEES